MRTKTIFLYDYNELSDEAKEHVRQWYLRAPGRSVTLSEEFEALYVRYFFPHSDLVVQWSLNACQGDGVNIYGKLDLNEVLTYIEKWNLKEHPGDERVFNPCGLLTEKEQRRLAFYVRCLGQDVELPYHWGYTYCLANQIDFSGEMLEALERQQLRNIDWELILKFQSIVIQIIRSLCTEMESYGYTYLYEVDDEEVSEACIANNWTFTSDGTFEPAE